MSYDLWMLRKSEVGDDPATAYARLVAASEASTPEAVGEAERRLAADLQAANPALAGDAQETDDRVIIQLGYDSERPVVIDISRAEITMSWSYGADEVSEALREVALYLPVFDRHGYAAYDPQLERLFDPERDAAAAAEVHRYVQAKTFAKHGLPWWKRLLVEPRIKPPHR